MGQNMPSADLAEIWSLFAQEGKENLALAEQALLALEPDPGNAEQIKVLFRALHSFKGGARMMGLHVVETLAHRAEDLIALVRDDGVSLAPEMVDLHLAVLDRLRAMLDRVLADGHDVEPGEGDDLVAKLQDLIERSRPKPASQSAQESTAAAEPAAAPETTTVSAEASVAQAAPALRLEEPQEQSHATETPEVAPELPGRGPSIAESGPEPPIAPTTPAATAEAVGEAADRPAEPLEGARANEAPGPEQLKFLKTTENDLSLLHAALDDLERGVPDALGRLQAAGSDLKKAALGVGYGRLAAILDDLDSETRVAQPSDEKDAQLIQLKKLDLEIFEELTRIQDSSASAQPAQGGWTDIAWLFRHWNAEQVFANLARLSEIADSLDLLAKQFTVETTVLRQGETLAEEASVLLKAIYHSCIFYHLDQAVHLSLALADIYGRIAQGELIVSDVLTRLTRDYVTHLGESIDATREGESSPSGEFDKLIDQAQNFLYLHTDGPVFQVTRSVLDVLKLPADFKEVMTPETMAKFGRSLQAGERFYTVLADLERDEALGAAFLEWSSSDDIHLITNVTVYRYDRTLFNFLFGSRQSRETILAALKKMDPRWQYLTLEECTLREQVDVHNARDDKPTEVGDADNGGGTKNGGVSTEIIESINETLSRLVADHTTLQRVVSRMAERDLVETVLRVTGNSSGDGGRMHRQVEESLTNWLEGINTLYQIESQVTSALGQLQEATRSLRLSSASKLLAPLRRMVQELAQQQGKLVDLDLQGSDLAIDRSAIEALEEPVRRLVWFAVTQGIEDVESRRAAGKATAGHIMVKVSRGEDHAQVVVEDDGRGLDCEAIRQRAAELGWANEANSDASQTGLLLRTGYGAVGGADGVEGIDLSAIAEMLRARHGQLNVQSAEGKGTRFGIRLPLDMAVVDGMVVRVGRIRYVVPVNAIVRVVKPQAGDVVHSSADGGHELLRFDGQVIEIRPLSGQGEFRTDQLLMALEGEGGRVALPIDELVGRQQVLVRPLQGQMADMQQVSGCALLGEGEVGMVLDLTREQGRVACSPRA